MVVKRKNDLDYLSKSNSVTEYPASEVIRQLKPEAGFPIC